MIELNRQWMQAAITLSLQSVRSGKGGPFGAVVVKEGEMIAQAHNQVTSTNDPTAHAEISAIRAACKILGTFSLKGCELYTSCEPCPMCLGAIYWARLDRVYYANTKEDAAAIGFDDRFIWDEFTLPMRDRTGGAALRDRAFSLQQLMRDEALTAFQEWATKPDKIEY